MGLISKDAAEAYKKATPSTSKRMDTGVQEATITKVHIETDKEKIKRPWVDVELVVTFENEAGAKGWHNIELMPNTDKQGEPSQGKWGYVKGQLEHMGYLGELDEFDAQAQSILGATCRISVEDKVGKPKPGGGNYLNREIYVQELIKPGVGGGSAASVGDDFVPVDDDEDDDIPF